MTLLAAAAVDAALVIAIALTASVPMRKWSSARRHAVLAAALFAGAAAPAVELLGPVFEVPIGMEATPPVSSSTIQAIPAPWPPAGSSEPLAATPVTPRMSFASVIVSTWLFGAVIVLAGLVASLARLSRLASCCTTVTSGPWRDDADACAHRCGVSRRVTLLQSADPSLLLTWGLLRPRIVLPAGANNWDAERRQVVLIHELAHIRRADWALQIAAEVVRAAHWFNPLVWIACRRLRDESERACDDAVLATGMAPTTYASHLLDVARHATGYRRTWAPAPAVANPSTLERRITAMLKLTHRREPLTWRAGAITLAGAIVVSASVAAIGLTQQAEPADVASDAASSEARGVQDDPAAPPIPPRPVTPAAPPTPQTLPAPARPTAPAAPTAPTPVPPAPGAPAAALPRPVVPAPPPAPERAVVPASPAAPPAAIPNVAPPAPPSRPVTTRDDQLPASPVVVQPPAPPATPAPPVNAPQGTTIVGSVPQGTTIIEATTFVSGTIDDPSGGVLPGAQVSLLDSDFIVRSTTVTDANGRFRFRVAQPGRYYVVVNHPGSAPFSTAVFAPSEGLRLRLPVAGVEESIVVTCSGGVASNGRMLQLVVDTGETGGNTDDGLLARARLRFRGSLSMNSTRGQPAVSQPALQDTTTRQQPVRVGGQITAPQLETRVNPQCPSDSLPGEEALLVILSGRIDTEGALRDIGSEQLAGVPAAPRAFVDAALDAVRQWKYTPAMLNGRVTEVPVRIRVEFRRSVEGSQR